MDSIEALLVAEPRSYLGCTHDGETWAAREEVGCTALLIACMYLKVRSAKLLLHAGADPKFKNKDGFIAYMRRQLWLR